MWYLNKVYAWGISKDVAEEWISEQDKIEKFIPGKHDTIKWKKIK